MLFKAKVLSNKQKDNFIEFVFDQIGNIFPDDGVFYVGGIPCYLDSVEVLADKGGRRTLEGIEPGYIFSTPGRGIPGWASRTLTAPHTSRYHYGLIGDYISGEDDYTVLESVGKGIAVGRLSFYDVNILEIYRIVDPEIRKLGHLATLELTRYGRAKYDYLLLAKLLFGGLKLFCKQIWQEHRLRAINYWELPYTADSRFICTEAANEAWAMVGYPIKPNINGPAIPAAFQHALDIGFIEIVYPPINVVSDC